MILSFINIHKVPWETLKTEGEHLPLDLANVNEWKIMFDHYIVHPLLLSLIHPLSYCYTQDTETSTKLPFVERCFDCCLLIVTALVIFSYKGI